MAWDLIHMGTFVRLPLNKHCRITNAITIRSVPLPLLVCSFQRVLKAVCIMQRTVTHYTQNTAIWYANFHVDIELGTILPRNTTVVIFVIETQIERT